MVKMYSAHTSYIQLVLLLPNLYIYHSRILRISDEYSALDGSEPQKVIQFCSE